MMLLTVAWIAFGAGMIAGFLMGRWISQKATCAASEMVPIVNRMEPSRHDEAKPSDHNV
jgi:hypothetical protein